MTWGSNPSGRLVECRRCGASMLDEGVNVEAHNAVCPARWWVPRITWARFWAWVRG